MMMFQSLRQEPDDLTRIAAQRRQRAEGAVGLIGLAALVFGLLRRDPLVVGLTGVYLAASIVARIYRRFGHRSTSLELELRPRRIFPDQELELRIRLQNRKRLPLPWVRLSLDVPRRAELEAAVGTKTPNWLTIVLPFTLGGRSGAERRLRMRLPVRGRHPFGGGLLTVVDPLGLESNATFLPTDAAALVYPRLQSVGARLRQSLPVGDRRGRSFIDEPSRYTGPRAYRPGDPLRRIDWQRSAVLGELHVKTFETVATSASAIFLDPTTARRSWDGIDPEVLERTVSTAASIAHHLIGRGEAVGLYVTGVFSEAGGHRPFSVRERPRTGARHLGRLLEALAQLRPPGLFRNLPAIMLEEVPRLDYAVQVIVIAPYLSDELAIALERLSRSRRIFFLATGRTLPSDPALPARVRPLRLEGAR